MRRRLSSAFCALLAAALLLPSLAAGVRGDGMAAGALRFGPRDSVLVVAPHPDDESLCCAGVLQRARAAGARVAIVWLTGGDAFELDARLTERTLRPGREGLLQLGMRRAGEPAQAAAVLGVPEAGRFFLGYPDRGLRHLLSANFEIPYRSPYTGATRVFLHGALRPNAPYEGRALIQDLRAVIDQQQPTHVFAASPLDTHPDHRASGELVARLMEERGQTDRVWYWIVHGGLDWPHPRGLHRDLPLLPPRSARQLEWRAFALSRSEQDAKLAALAAHRSQMQIMSAFLQAFVRSNELFTRPAARRGETAPARAPESSIIGRRKTEGRP